MHLQCYAILNFPLSFIFRLPFTQSLLLSSYYSYFSCIGVLLWCVVICHAHCFACMGYWWWCAAIDRLNRFQLSSCTKRFGSNSMSNLSRSYTTTGSVAILTLCLHLFSLSFPLRYLMLRGDMRWWVRLNKL
jgi:hypothetical protein